MKENKNEQVASISKAQTLEEIADYWDTHSLTDHWNETHEAHFEVQMQRKCRVTLTPEIYKKLRNKHWHRESYRKLWLTCG